MLFISIVMSIALVIFFFFFFFFNDTATTEIYTLSLHDALPIFSARCTASTRAVALPGSAAPKDRRSANDGQDGSVGLVMQKSLHASSACSRNCSSVSAYCAGAAPMMRYSFGSSPAACRWDRSEERRVGKEGRSRWSP